uniref:hypothetical protein n=1 Tax=Candidatus Fimivicinus sp. TaxID=3056640 RepID=UPI003FEF4D6D
MVQKYYIIESVVLSLSFKKAETHREELMAAWQGVSLREARWSKVLLRCGEHLLL